MTILLNIMTCLKCDLFLCEAFSIYKYDVAYNAYKHFSAYANAASRPNITHHIYLLKVSKYTQLVCLHNV